MKSAKFTFALYLNKDVIDVTLIAFSRTFSCTETGNSSIDHTAPFHQIRTAHGILLF